MHYTFLNKLSDALLRVRHVVARVAICAFEPFLQVILNCCKMSAMWQ